MSNNISIKDLKEKVKGKWSLVLEDLAPELAEAMAELPAHVSCPVHGGVDGFRLFEDFNDTGGGYCNTCGAKADGLAMLAWVRGYSLRDAITDVCKWAGEELSKPTTALRKPLRQPKPKDRAKAYANIRKAWLESLPLAGTAGELYLASRGIWKENMPRSLRFHPGMPYSHWNKKTKKLDFYGVFPCILAPIKNEEGAIVSLHRIFITEQGAKAPVPDPKKMMTATVDNISGSAIRLFPAEGEVLGLAEGIETALAAHAISRMPVWSCVSATLLESVHIPDSVKVVVIWADLDVSNRGIEAANKLADFLEKQGKRVEVYLPNTSIPEGKKGIDWLDVLELHGLSGFPARWRRWRPALCPA